MSAAAAATVAVMLPVAVMAMSYPPYDIYPYLADSTDNPPLNYTKVCEPGRTGEANGPCSMTFPARKSRARS